jgi:hypothetical protein
MKKRVAVNGEVVKEEVVSNFRFQDLGAMTQSDPKITQCFAKISN